MKKSLFATCVALLVAVAIPSAASAVELYSGTTKLPVGTTIVAESNLVQFGNVLCDKSKITGTLAENGKEIKIPISSITFAGAYSDKCRNGLSGYKSEDTGVKFSQEECLMGNSTTYFGMFSFPGGACSGSTLQNHYLYYSGPFECKYTSLFLQFSVTGQAPLVMAVNKEFGLVSGSAFCWSSQKMSGSYTFSAPGYGPLRTV